LSDDLTRMVLASHRLPLPDEWEESLIHAIGEDLLLKPENQYIALDLSLCAAEIGAPNDDAVYRTILDLTRQKILEGQTNVHHVQVTLTPAGWRRFKEIPRSPEPPLAQAA